MYRWRGKYSGSSFVVANQKADKRGQKETANSAARSSSATLDTGASCPRKPIVPVWVSAPRVRRGSCVQKATNNQQRRQRPGPCVVAAHPPPKSRRTK